MTDTPETPQAGLAEALHDLSDQTRVLVRHETDAALREMWEKAKQAGPPAGLLVASGILGLLAAASSYRLSLRLLEKRLPPASAALAATLGYGTAAACAALLGARAIRNLPPPIPAQTMQEASTAVADATTGIHGSASSAPAEQARASQ